MSDDRLGWSTATVVRNTLVRTIGSVLALVGGAVTGLVVARDLGPEGFGSFGFVWTVAWSVVTFVPLGLDALLVRELNRRPRLLDLRRALPIVTLSGATLGAVLVLAAALAGAGAELLQAVAAAAVYVAAGGPLLVVRAVFDAREQMELTAATDVVESFLALAAVWYVLAVGGGVVEVSVALAATRVATLGLAAAAERRRRGPAQERDPRRSLADLLRAGLPMAGSRLTTELGRRAGVVVLGVMVAPEEVGWYVAALTIVVYAPVLMLELNRALYPVLSRADSGGDQDLLRVFDLAWRFHLVVGTSVAAGLAVLGGPIVVMLYGEAYAPAGPLLSVLAVTVPLRVMSSLCAITLDATYRQGARLRASALALAVKLVVDLLLIPVIGVWGAVWAAVAGEAALFAASIRPLRPHRPRLLVPLAHSLLCAAPVAAAAALTPGSTVVRLVAGAAAFLVTTGTALGRRLRATAAAPQRRRTMPTPQGEESP